LLASTDGGVPGRLTLDPTKPFIDTGGPLVSMSSVSVLLGQGMPRWRLALFESAGLLACAALWMGYETEAFMLIRIKPP